MKTFLEYINSAMSDVKNHFNRSEDDKILDRAYEYSYKFEDFFQDLMDNDDKWADWINDNIENDDLENIGDIIEKLPKELIVKFGEWLEDFVNSGYEQNHDVFDKGDIFKNQWLIHFTDNAYGIWKRGFEYGENDCTLLGYTNAGSTNEYKKNCGKNYNFAYKVGENWERYATSNRGRGYKYGKECVLFRASGVGAWHYGDEEPQSIFWGETATDIIPISYNDYLGAWIVDSITDGDWEDRKLPRYEDLSKLVDWVVANYTQYRKLLGASTPHK